MRIKEVEEATGLTAKAIRLYESKGLLSVARQSENGYRDYSDEDVKRLRTISFLRDLDIPMKDIKDWTDGTVTLQELLRIASERLEDDKDNAGIRAAIAQTTAAQMEKDPKLDWEQAMEEAELAKAMYGVLCQTLKEDDRDLGGVVQATVVALCPIAATLYAIWRGSVKLAFWGFGMSIVCVIAATYFWMRYLRVPKKHRSRSGCLPMVVGIAVLAVGVIVFSVLMSGLHGKLYLRGQDGFCLFRQPWRTLVWLPLVELLAAVLFTMEHGFTGWKEMYWKKQWIAGAVAVNLLLVYCTFTGVSTCSGGEFCRRSPLDPLGSAYTVEQVERVEVSFKGDLFGIPLTSTGELRYEIVFSDGTTEDWAGCLMADSGENFEDLAKLDRLLMDAGVEKMVDLEFWDEDNWSLDTAATIREVLEFGYAD